MKLDGEQARELQRALISAFPGQELKQMVRHQLGESLNAIAGGETQSDVVFNLIAWAEAKGRLEELVEGAYQENPGNPELKAFCQKWKFTQNASICPQNIPSSNTEKFVGREFELKNIHQKLENSDEVVIAHLEGMAGVGKTELAIQYSLSHLKNYPGGISWVNAGEQQDVSL